MLVVRLIALGATLWMGCATFADRAPTPTFPQDLAAGCESTRACSALAARGRERVRVCEEENLDCSAARAEAKRAEQLERDAAVREWTETRRREQALAAEERRRQEEGDRAAQEEQAQRRERERAAREDQARRMKEAEAEAQARLEEERRHAAEQAQPAPTPAPAQRPAPTRCTATVQCCDGTCSPSCTTVHRGCCSHHGGVCDG